MKKVNMLFNMSKHGVWRGPKYLKLNDTKNTFISPMTSTGMLNERIENYEKTVWNLLLLD